MNALDFLKRHGKGPAEAVATAAGTNWAYFSQIAYGHRRPSVDMAERLVAASAAAFPLDVDQLDLLSLLKAPAAKSRGDKVASQVGGVG